MKKKILILSSTFPRWANDHEPPFIYELSKRFTDKYDVHVLSPHAPGSLSKESLNGLSIHRFRYAPASLEKLAYDGGISTNLRNHPVRYLLVLPFIIAELIYAIRIIRQENIDLIHAHWIIPQGLVSAIASAITKNRPAVLVTAHGADVYTRKGTLHSIIKKNILNRCRNLTVVSQAMAESVQQLNSSCEISVIPMGTDLTNTFIPDYSKKVSSQLIFVGRLVEKKGVRYLLDGFNMLVSKYPSLSLVIIGHGPEEEALLKYSKSLGVSEKITFTGGLPQAELPLYLQKSDIAVFPFIQAKDGDQEGFGLVLVEAMGCGCATITTDIPAVKDIIMDKITGVLIKGKNPDDIFSAVSELIDRPQLRERISKNGREYVKENFDWSVISSSYLELISTILKEDLAKSK